MRATHRASPHGSSLRTAARQPPSTARLADSKRRSRTLARADRGAGAERRRGSAAKPAAAPNPVVTAAPGLAAFEASLAGFSLEPLEGDEGTPKPTTGRAVFGVPDAPAAPRGEVRAGRHGPRRSRRREPASGDDDELSLERSTSTSTRTPRSGPTRSCAAAPSPSSTT